MASTSETSAAQDFSHVIYDFVKCFICQGRVKAGKPQWFHCTRGHAICPDCKIGRSTCPACHGYIRNGHSRLLEALLNLDKMVFKCENLIRGCREIKDRHFVWALEFAGAGELGGQSEHRSLEAAFVSNFSRCMWRITEVAWNAC